ncbi:MAG: hypothetical protein FJ167_04185 [Gammaproteobacteria bacterium]|nr:hypothetical protein [Gammaproteobacteria bacterium]
MTTERTHQIIVRDEERESAASNLADSLFSAEGSYASALLRLSRTFVDLKGAMFVRAVAEEIADEIATEEEGS